MEKVIMSKRGKHTFLYTYEGVLVGKSDRIFKTARITTLADGRRRVMFSIKENATFDGFKVPEGSTISIVSIQPGI